MRVASTGERGNISDRYKHDMQEDWLYPILLHFYVAKINHCVNLFW